MAEHLPSPVTRPEHRLLAGLNEPQAEAVTHVTGPLLVMAGPGSGKTRVITSRAAYLVLGVGIAPWNVLALTFTNKAAGEMQQRVAQLVSDHQARALTVCTFHSLCAAMLRRYADRINLLAGFSIYDTADQQRAVKQALEDLEISATNFAPSSVLAAISKAKNELVDAEAYGRSAADFYSRTVAKVYRKYDQILRRNQALDFDDLLVRMVSLIKEDRQVLAELQDRYQYIMIDEYQDTNHAQFLIASTLADRHKNLCATGDPDQSIYGWRGANIQNILDFETHYPRARVVRLEQNYRSTPQILAMADGLISHNKRRKPKRLWTELPQGKRVRVVTCQDEHHEARWVVQQLQRLRDDEVSWGDMAIFYRINSLSRVLEDSLRENGVPYQIARGTAFYARAEIKSTVAYLRAIVNPADEVSLFRIINTPARGISDRSVKVVRAFAMANNHSVDEVLSNASTAPALNQRARNSVAKFSAMLTRWRRTAGFGPSPGDPRPDDSSLRAFVEQVILESGLHALYKNDKSDPDQQRLANLGEFVTFAQQFESEFELEITDDQAALAEKLLGFLERISLISDVDAIDPEQGAVTLMTLHAAKGLEYPVVAMIGTEDGLLPHSRAHSDERQIEEERRLCFVGITRAMHTLMVTHARYRAVFGRTSTTIPSRFLEELPDDTLIREDVCDEADPFRDMVERAALQRTMASREVGRYPPGARVRHPQFGVGRILDVAPMGAHTRAKVEFHSVGIKTLILQYARLELL